MSCLNCLNKPATMETVKKVTFYNRVKIFYYRQTPVESNICWQQVARDRSRFKRRIIDVELRIGWVFTNNHRSRAFNVLYCT